MMLYLMISYNLYEILKFGDTHYELFIIKFNLKTKNKYFNSSWVVPGMLLLLLVSLLHAQRVF